MNKLPIMIILTVTVLIAGVFAFVPIDKAITIHTDIGVVHEIIEDVVLPRGGTDVKITFTAGGDLLVTGVFLDVTPTCNPVPGGGGFECSTSDEDFDPTLDGDTDDDPLCDLSEDSISGGGDPAGDHFSLECDDVGITLLNIYKLSSDGFRIGQQGDDNLTMNIGGSEDKLEKRDILRRIGAASSNDEPIGPIPLLAGQKLVYIFDNNPCDDDDNAIVIDFEIVSIGSGTLASVEIGGEETCNG